MRPLSLCFIAFIGILSAPVYAKDKLKLDTTIIKGNKEMPQIVYIVPWKEMKEKKNQDQTLVLHSLFGDLYDPVRADSDKLK